MIRLAVLFLLALVAVACGTAVPGQPQKPAAAQSAPNPNSSNPAQSAKAKATQARSIAGPERVDAGFRLEPTDATGPYRAVLPRPDGRVVVAANSLFQVLENGQPDGSFAPIAFPETDPYGVRLALEPDGRVDVIRYDKSRSELLRLRADGTPEAGFGSDGRVRVGFHLRGVRATPRGLLLVGSAWSDGGAASRLVIARLDERGRKDRTFAGGGFHALPWSLSRGEGLELLPDGRFLVAGSANGEPAVLRFNRDGSLDRRFGRDGVARLGPSPCAALFRFIGVAPSGAIYAAGDLHRHVVARFTPGGRPDAGFAGTGHACFGYRIVDNSVETQFAEITGLAAQADESVILAGYALDWEGELRGLSRFDRRGQRDRAFLVDRSVAELAQDAQGRALVISLNGGVERLLPR